uniref:Uncharacterized protein n=1 Tax=Fusarium oxysporum f. sp. cucumerinum TaxID=5508 RepID=A0A2C8D128_FUSOX|nr:TPA: hypothetical protein [Fusarium oxysporum f. sp. cucumerinum]SNU77083.1 TPA: hypothetical protein [Fusarium oxysporum f. sp. cucumerinum]SNU77112.1 TPA: hypothetical protein [Fusarium oxysporum f. sp. cucumerinum]
MKFIKICKLFFNKLFLPTNLSKIIVIFSVGLLSRYLINEYMGVNVFMEYLSFISITFYSLFATFVVFINELFSFFNINIIPNFLINILNSSGIILEFLVVKPFIFIYSNLWGKYYGGSFIRNSKTGVANDGYSRNNNYTNNNYYSNNEEATSFAPTNNNNYPNNNNYSNNNEGVGPYGADNTSSYYSSNPYFSASTLVSKYPSQVQVADYSKVQTTQMNLENISMYTGIANQNPYSEWSTSGHSNPGAKYGQQGASYPPQSSYMGEANLESTLGQHPALRGSDSAPRFFTFDRIIGENGVERDFITPPLNSDSPSNAYEPSVQYSSEYCPSPAFTNQTRGATCDGHTSKNPKLIQDWNKHIQKGREKTIKELGLRDKNRTLNLHEIANPSLKYKEIPVLKSPTRGEAAICMEYHNSSNIKNIFIKYHDVAKRKFFWNIWEKNRDTYGSYAEFKKSFDPGMNIWKEIYKQTKADLSAEVKNLLDDDILKSKHHKPQIRPRDIRRLHNSSAQSRLNHESASRYTSYPLPNRARKH